MFLDLSHTKLNVYQLSQELAMECYKITRTFPVDEKFAMVQQIRRAALSVHLNIAEGCSRKSKAERKRFFEIARGSVIEIDSAIGIAHKLTYATLEQLKPLGDAIINNFKVLTGIIAKNE
ncbi:four helix bundle protein [Niastella koreensis]|uniref:S23 ribosomal protein n=2 Tax=Niastella koreensis TaxID=354356 RepID=G8T914_NIAKG|nr:four helix bundle protein [Niastella koreensis]AEV96967.1 S23 ribosomal protein [Niastella koreensis GR20-10]OQP39337.1 four helix bundle protein [Niastella koreensis]